MGTANEGRRERVNRELIELLNEIRVALPGVQVLFAFMLILPFSQGFTKLSHTQRWVYLAAFLCAAIGTALLIAPSSYHRLRFRYPDKERMLIAASRMTIAGMACVAVSMTCVVGLVGDVVFGTVVGVLAGVGVGGVFAWFWYGLPLSRDVEADEPEP